MKYSEGNYTLVLPRDEVVALRKAAAVIGGLASFYTEWHPEDIDALRRFVDRFGAKLRET